MRLLRTILASLILVLGPPAAITAWIWANYRYPLPLWSGFGLTMTIAAISALNLPIHSGHHRVLAVVGLSLVTAVLTVPYWLFIVCGLFGDCI